MYWLTDFRAHQKIIMVISLSLKKKLTNKYKEKLVILQLIGIIVIKSKEIRMITYTCRYSSGHLIPTIQSRQDELGIRISAGVGDHPCFLTFITMIPIDCKITNFSLYLLN